MMNAVNVPDEGGLRERKKRRTRKDLQRAATWLFAERGYAETTVEDIAVAADVSRRTLFRYFPTKESLAFPDTEARIGRFRALLSLRPPGETAFQATRRALLGMAREYVDDRESIVAQQRVIDASPTLLAAERAFDEQWEVAIAEALLARTGPRPDRERWARVLAAATFGVVRATIREWIVGDGEGDLIETGVQTLDLLEEGFGLGG